MQELKFSVPPSGLYSATCREGCNLRFGRDSQAFIPGFPRCSLRNWARSATLRVKSCSMSLIPESTSLDVVRCSILSYPPSRLMGGGTLATEHPPCSYPCLRRAARQQHSQSLLPKSALPQSLLPQSLLQPGLKLALRVKQAFQRKPFLP